MNLIRLVEGLAAEDMRSVTLLRHRCLHAGDRFQDCSHCIDICPTRAITGNKQPDFDVERCKYCLACLPACPAGAFVAEDEVPTLLRCVRDMSVKRIELVCKYNRNAGKGVPGVEAAIKVQGCLAGLGVGAFLLLAAEGSEQVIVRNDACTNCHWSVLNDLLTRQVSQAQELLHLWNLDNKVKVSGPVEASWRTRPIYPAGSPPVSRRDLFRPYLTTRENSAGRPVPDGNQPFRERLRLMQAYQQLGPPQVDTVTRQLPGLGFATLAVSTACNACGACARACPTAALTLDIDDEAYALHFESQACIGCDICVHVCPVGAVEIDHAPSFNQLFVNPVRKVLQSGSVSRCRRCHAYFPTTENEVYCDICRFRLRNPFGAARPENTVGERKYLKGVQS